MKFGVVVFPGSNCDEDTVYVLETLMGQQVVKLWHKDQDLKACEAIILPGGFSFGDYLRSGAIARFSPIMEQVIPFAHSGGFVLGICNGFQILAEAGLLPGVLLHNHKRLFISCPVFLKTVTHHSRLTQSIPEGRVLSMPIAHGEGRYYTDPETLKTLYDGDQILLKYCDRSGALTEASNPNGSLDHIAAICNPGRNVYGLMPHPERAADPFLGNSDGAYLFKSILQSALAVS